eukprot:m.51082 g.51082  ORF g.51082 m.51082 type:complete len:52 (-) comp10709_c0_seq2:1656-1811(-)
MKNIKEILIFQHISSMRQIIFCFAITTTLQYCENTSSVKYLKVGGVIETAQ